MGLEDVGGRNDVTETVGLGDQPALFRVGARHEDSLVLEAVGAFDELTEGSV